MFRAWESKVETLSNKLNPYMQVLAMQLSNSVEQGNVEKFVLHCNRVDYISEPKPVKGVNREFQCAHMYL